jgi:hypothetical protein
MLPLPRLICPTCQTPIRSGQSIIFHQARLIYHRACHELMRAELTTPSPGGGDGAASDPIVNLAFPRR